MSLVRITFERGEVIEAEYELETDDRTAVGLYDALVQKAKELVPIEE